MRRKPTNALTCACGETVFANTTFVWIAIVDKEDGHWLVDYKWSVMSSNSCRDGVQYAKSGRLGYERGITNMRLHQVIVPYALVDHKDGNGHNNRRSNLRDATDADNARNARKRLHAKTSRFKGVHWNGKQWVVQLPVDGKRTYIGAFPFEIDAAICYNYHAAYLYGEFVRLNPIPEGEWCHD